MTSPAQCESCGAALRIPDKARWVRCDHCGTQLAVRRREKGGTFTRKLQRIAKRTDRAATRFAEFQEVQRELEALDAEWDRELRNQGWPEGGPRRRERVVPAIIVAGFGVLFVGGLAKGGYDAVRSGHSDALFFLVPMMVPVAAFCGLALAGMYRAWRKETSDIQRYRAARQGYLKRRGELADESRKSEAEHD